MGFREDIEDIARCLKPAGERQTYMFSATMPSAIRQVASTTLASNYKFINCVPKDAAPTHLSIPQYYTSCSDANEQIAHILRLIAEDQLANPGKSKVLVFLSTTKMVQLYSMILMSIGKNALPLGRATRFEQIHSKKTMSSRMNISKWFRHHTGGSAVLLTSDVSARGVDYPGITRVIQIGVPSSSETYVHRVGRTARAGRTGMALSFVVPKEQWGKNRVVGCVGQGDELVRGGNQHIEGSVLDRGVCLVRIAQVVDRVHQGFAVGVQRGRDAFEFRRGHGVEPEVEMEDVEVLGVVVDPVHVQHDQWPPGRAGNGTFGSGIG